MTSSDIAPKFKMINEDFVLSSDIWNEREREPIDYQLNDLYMVRLNLLKDRIHSSAKKQYGEDIQFSDYFDLEDENSGLLCGVLQLKLKDRKSIITNIEVDDDALLTYEDNGFEDEIKKSEKDCLNLVTNDYIVKLSNIDIYNNSHGAVVGIYGHKLDNGNSFFVENIIYPEPALQKEILEAKEETYMCFISDLKFSQSKTSERECYLNFLSTCFQEGGNNLPEDIKNIFRGIERVIIAGGTFDDSEFYKRSYNILDLKDPLITHKQLLEADKYFKSLTNCAPVHVIPGICDIGTGSWPIQVPYRGAYTICSKLEKDFFLTTNPTFFETNGRTYLGMSGDSVADILRIRDNKSSLDVMEQLLRYQHLAPTSPDHMSIFVSKSDDFMVLKKTPHVFFVGGQSYFDRKTIRLGDYDVLLLSLPSFSTTNTVTFVNTKTLEAIPFTFNLCI
uniref:DNA polymerase delta subunit 2 (inferred by orthology to a human protein) n=1 Tax=Strongyloides venezuelensis TaxID=75913 RepID=A0A0K0FL93_STRVS